MIRTRYVIISLVLVVIALGASLGYDLSLNKVSTTTSTQTLFSTQTVIGITKEVPGMTATITKQIIEEKINEVGGCTNIVEQTNSTVYIMPSAISSAFYATIATNYSNYSTTTLTATYSFSYFTINGTTIVVPCADVP
jgi:hypothetical protein